MTTNTEGQVHLRCGAFEKQFKLSWTQKSILDKTEDAQHVLVAGPPGTGKTTVLLCKGLQWLEEGRDVLVCSIHKNSVPTCCYLYTVLSEAKKARDSARCPEDPAKTGLVKYSDFVLSDKQEADNALDHLQASASAPTDRPSGFIFDYMFPETLDQSQLALDFIKELKDRVPQSPIWTSDWYSSIPEGFFLQQMMTPLRFTQQIFSLIKLPVDALRMSCQLPDSYNYRTAVYRNPPAGPDVIHLRHKGSSSGVDKWPVNSEKCGRKVAKVLREIGVGVGATEGESEAKGEQSTDKGDHYQYRDVLVLTRNELMPGHTPAFARGLEAAGIPTAVCCPGDDVTMEEALNDVILAPEDKVVVMNNQAAIGLDRKVVVCLTGTGKDETWEVTAEENRQIQANEVQAGTLSMGDSTLTLTLNMNAAQKKEFREEVQRAHWSEMELIHRLTIWTRCSRQLIVVHLPKDVQGPREFKMHDSLISCAVM